MPPTPALDVPGKTARRESVVNSAIVDKLQSVGLKSVAWTGRCEADKVSMGRYDVPAGESGTYGLVFDNTFSKQTSKNVTLVLITHPTSAPPKSGHHLHYSQAFASGSSSSLGTSPALKPAAESTESLPQGQSLYRGVLEDPRPASKGGHLVESKGLEGNTFYTGVLSKKRRKKGQGFAKRYFSLDFTSSTLSYYRDRHSSALRGAVPLSLAAVGVNEKSREFSVDSGAEVWHLKALNRKDFEGWRDALERASGSAATASTPVPPTQSNLVIRKIRDAPVRLPDPQEEVEWERVERLVSAVAGTRDAVRGLAKDTDPKYAVAASTNAEAGTMSVGLGVQASSDPSSPTHLELPGASHNPYFPDLDDQPGANATEKERRMFWKRKPSVERSPSALFRRSFSTQLAVPSPSLAGGNAPSPTGSTFLLPRRPSTNQVPLAATAPTVDVHERCMALLHDLDTVVAEFTALIAESKGRRNPPLPTSTSRMSMESNEDQEYFDADDGARSVSQLLRIRRDTESEVGDHTEEQQEHHSDVDSDTSSFAGERAASAIFGGAAKVEHSGAFPRKLESIPPLPCESTARRTTIAPPKQSPPSIIGFLRKNAGKDLSTVAMPVTANEPTSLLQRLAENMEYSALLDSASAPGLSDSERLMYVAAFAISQFANNRVRERAVRKPFNPMLGETYELVRPDLGFRFVAEKVSHHPVRTACQAESLAHGTGWTYTQAPKPVQKFWGKSVELNTEGRARVVLHAASQSQGDHRYSWTQAPCFLRNVIAGEKYVEPVQTMTVRDETNGARAVVTFKSGGMFSGRTEEVNVQLFDATAPDTPLGLGLAGTWTTALHRTDTDATVWTAGALVPDAPRVYGFTTFAAALNEVTPLEEGRLPPTDSRLRPDQRALEDGEVDRAEALKARLEERQRGRRKVLEAHGQTWHPQFFEKAETGLDGDEDDDAWVLREGVANGYWERRQRGDWSGVQEVFET